MCCLNDINYHVDDVLKTTQCGGRSARSPDVYWMLQDCIRQRSMETGCILSRLIYQSVSREPRLTRISCKICYK